jgi:hypothetical protein
MYLQIFVKLFEFMNQTEDVFRVARVATTVVQPDDFYLFGLQNRWLHRCHLIMNAPRHGDDPVVSDFQARSWQCLPRSYNFSQVSTEES